jgi:hypothetical protein
VIFPGLNSEFESVGSSFVKHLTRPLLPRKIDRRLHEELFWEERGPDAQLRLSRAGQQRSGQSSAAVTTLRQRHFLRIGPPPACATALPSAFVAGSRAGSAERLGERAVHAHPRERRGMERTAKSSDGSAIALRQQTSQRTNTFWIFEDGK